MQNKPSRQCHYCGKRFYKSPFTSRASWLDPRRYRACSRKCVDEAKIGISPWNKGLIGKQVAWNKGIPFSPESRAKMSVAKSGKKWTPAMRSAIPPSLPRGRNHPNWKGHAVGYMALHSWVKRQMGRASHCEYCKLDKVPPGKKRYFQWANLSKEYHRDVKDWIQLCSQCHAKYDRDIIQIPIKDSVRQLVT